MPPAHLKGPTKPHQHVPGCSGKVAYGSPEDARRGVRHARKKLNIYRCEFCRHWHCSSMRKKDKR